MKSAAQTLILVCAFVSLSFAQSTVHHVSALRPIIGNSREFGADRATASSQSHLSVATASATHPWQKLATIPGAVIHDIAFPTANTGYAAAELGQVWKTTDGGKTWTEVLNLNFPYYWYGVAALDADNVLISGFNDSNFEGIARWSHDGGTTWSDDIILTTTGWTFRTRFADSLTALAMDGLSLTAPNAAHYSTDGGATAADWTQVAPVDPNGGWFGNQFTLLKNSHAYASGISYCSSTNAGQSWACGPSIDSVFDGPTYFVNDTAGWVGGGEISPNVEGWVHRTTDGGVTWSGRTLDDPWPIREIRFLSPQVGWAAGGNIFTGVGGIYFSQDGGQTWSLDVDTGAEMDACAARRHGARYEIWCAGTDASFNGVVYMLRN